MTSLAHVREATESDAASLPSLLGQLGYPASASEIEQRLLQIQRFAEARAWVAAEEGAIVGLATCHMFPSIHINAPVAWLTTLVVDEAHRGRGIGRALVEVSEAWAAERGAVRLSLTSGVQRATAHAFYARMGYEQTGVRLTRTLGSTRHAL